LGGPNVQEINFENLIFFDFSKNKRLQSSYLDAPEPETSNIASFNRIVIRSARITNERYQPHLATIYRRAI